MNQQKTKISSGHSKKHSSKMILLTRRLPISLPRRSLYISWLVVLTICFASFIPRRKLKHLLPWKTIKQICQGKYRLCKFHTCYVLCNTDVDMDANPDPKPLKCLAIHLLGIKSRIHQAVRWGWSHGEVKVCWAKEEGWWVEYIMCLESYIIQIVR